MDHEALRPEEAGDPGADIALGSQGVAVGGSTIGHNASADPEGHLPLGSRHVGRGRGVRQQEAVARRSGGGAVLHDTLSGVARSRGGGRVDWGLGGGERSPIDVGDSRGSLAGPEHLGEAAAHITAQLG